MNHNVALQGTTGCWLSSSCMFVHAGRKPGDGSRTYGWSWFRNVLKETNDPEIWKLGPGWTNYSFTEVLSWNLLCLHVSGTPVNLPHKQHPLTVSGFLSPLEVNFLTRAVFATDPLVKTFKLLLNTHLSHVNEMFSNGSCLLRRRKKLKHFLKWKLDMFSVSLL